MRSRTAPDLTGICQRCYQRLDRCVCAHVPRVAVRTEFLIVRHAKESWRTTNTARLASLAIPSVTLVDYGGLGGDRARLGEIVEAFLGPDTWVLFPGAGEWFPRETPPLRLVVPDGSWRQARNILRRVRGLDGLPRLSLGPRAGAFERLRRSPIPEGMSTLEAIAGAIAVLEGPAIARPLEALYDLVVERSLSARRRRGRTA